MLVVVGSVFSHSLTKVCYSCSAFAEQEVVRGLTISNVEFLMANIEVKESKAYTSTLDIQSSIFDIHY